jgi:hypothetical protein
VNPFPKQLRWYAATVFTVAVVVALGLALRGDDLPAVPLLILGAIVVYCANREVELPNGMFVSPGLMVAMAAVVAFGAYDSLLGPVLIGLLSPAYFKGLSRRTWGWLPFNAGITGTSMLFAALAYAAVGPDESSSIPFAVLGAVAAVCSYSIVSWLLIAASYSIEHRRRPRDVLKEFFPLLLQALPFAVLGCFVGRLYLAHGAGVLLLIVVPILIAREMFASYLVVKKSHDETVHMLVRALEAKDSYTAGHAERVATYAQYMGEAMAFGPARMERLRFAALMHDIGKLVVPNHILNKPGKLTADEYRRIRLHDQVSVDMLSHIDFLRPIAAQTHSDRMRFDPDDPNHPIEPYIVMIADAFDAMTSTRAYRKALPQEIAFQELRDKAGIQFHPECVEALIGALEERGEKHGAGYEETAEFDDAPDTGVGSAGLGDLLPSEAAGA